MRKIAVLLIVCLAGLSAFCQNDDPVVMKLGKNDVRFSEFRNTFAKNNDLAKMSDAELRGLIELFVNFRLKYAEAREKQLDTVAVLREELEEYRSQAVVPFLTDKEVSERIFSEAIERMKWDVRASHILKKVAMEAPPADTLEAYNAIMKLRQRILKGESFGDVAAKESDDNSAKDRKSAGGEVIQAGNRGELGYFTAFDMIYSFESGAYNTPVGSLSMPVRSEFGYHLIFIHDKRPALGKCKAMQILIPFNKSSNLTPSEKEQDKAKISNKINAIYEELKGGLTFEEAFEKYGEEGTNGKLPIFGCNRFEGDFVKGLYGLKEGEISKPIQSSHGFHIVKIEELFPVRTDEDAHGAIRTRIMQDIRSNKSKEAFIERIKKENGFSEAEDKKAKTTPVADFYTALDSNIFNGTYEAEMVKQLNRPMFVFAQKTYTQQDFAHYLEAHQFINVKDVETPIIVNFAYKRFIDNTIMEYEDSQAETKHPQFAEQMRDYKEGILIYELNERRVWRKAETDSIGLSDFYETVKQNYLYPVRVKAEYIKAVDAAATKKAEPLLKKCTPIQDVMAKMNKKNVTLVLDTVVYWHGQNKQFDKLVDWNEFNKAIAEAEAETKEFLQFNKTFSVTKISTFHIYTDKTENELYRVTEILPPSPKPLREVKGQVVAEYQNKLEDDWLKELHSNTIEVDYEKIVSLCRGK
jgi:peptidyl-prolyl cis-trans isomerase SurA